MPFEAGGRRRQVAFLASIDWNAPRQRHQSLAASFVQGGHEVFFLENTGLRAPRLSDAGRVWNRLRNRLRNRAGSGGAGGGGSGANGLRVISPVVAPPTGAVFRLLNRAVLVPRLARLLRASGLQDGAVAFAYLPTDTTLGIVDAIRPSLLVYDCVDYFQGHPGPPRDIDRTERLLLERSDLVLTTSPFLYERQRRRHPNVHRLHHGVCDAFLARAEEEPPDRYKRFCYFGTLWSAVDYAPLRALSEAGFEVDMIGPVKETPPGLPPGARILGPVPAPALPEILSRYDGLLLPYVDCPYNRGVLPAKTYECLAFGKPVLASPPRNFSEFEGLFYIPSAPEAWVETARALPDTESPAKRRARIDAARAHAASAQFAKLLAVLGETEAAGRS